MNFIRFFLIIFTCLFFAGEAEAEKIPANARKLIRHYKDRLAGFENNHLIFRDGTRLRWDDGIKNKSFQQLLDNPDIEDMFAFKYPKSNTGPPSPNEDPGRVRNQEFIFKIYGSSKAEVQQQVREIVWCPQLSGMKLKVTTLHGVDKKFEKISRQLDKHPELAPYVAKVAGTFAWRNIAGTDRLSMHSFGMTIDVNTRESHYWQWDCKCTNEDVKLGYSNKIPRKLVRIFERNGFIWGGKWYHYDTMHFEYRPELL